MDTTFQQILLAYNAFLFSKSHNYESTPTNTKNWNGQNSYVNSTVVDFLLHIYFVPSICLLTQQLVHVCRQVTTEPLWLWILCRSRQPLQTLGATSRPAPQLGMGCRKREAQTKALKCQMHFDILNKEQTALPKDRARTG